MNSIRLPTISVLAIMAMTTSGCAALSLFSSTHEHHYDGNPEIERRLTALEQRFNTFEQSHTATGPAIISGSGTAKLEDGIQHSNFAPTAGDNGASQSGSGNISLDADSGQSRSKVRRANPTELAAPN